MTGEGRDVFAAAGDLADLYAEIDWAATAYGHPDSWGPALRAAVDVVLNTRFPAVIFWGQELCALYNASYVELIADKHPAALGRPARESFSEAWAEIGPMFGLVLDGAGANWFESLLVPLDRTGFLEETYFTFSYSPVYDDEGRIGGVLNIATETSIQVRATRRLAVLARLREAFTVARDLDELVERSLEALRTDPADLAALEIRLDGRQHEVEDRLPRSPGVLRGDASERVAGPVGTVRLEDTEHGTVAWLPLGTDTQDADDVFVVLLSPMLEIDASYLEFLGLLATTLRQGIDRLRLRQAEHDLSTALQNSMLTGPVTSAGIDVAVRYVPAALLAQVGGDWYDVFPLPSGDVSVVVGDVAGHDYGAAAIMGQLRNLLRAVAYLGAVSPAGVLGGLERSITGLALDAVATAVVGELSELDTGSPVFRWANAGHPPPILLGADGTVELLERRAEMLLGIEDGVPRIDHVVRLPPGSTLLLYTDGLIERRGAHFDVGLTWLREALAGRQDLGAEEICDLLIEQAGQGYEDDVALVAVRVPG